MAAAPCIVADSRVRNVTIWPIIRRIVFRAVPSPGVPGVHDRRTDAHAIHRHHSPCRHRRGALVTASPCFFPFSVKLLLKLLDPFLKISLTFICSVSFSLSILQLFFNIFNFIFKLFFLFLELFTLF